MSYIVPVSFGGPAGVPAQRDESWKAQAFINITLPTKSGGRRQLAGIPLKASDPYHAKLIEWLSAGTEEEQQNRLITMFGKAEVDFRLVGTSDGDEFDLSGEE